jgi:hypothetical protein
MDLLTVGIDRAWQMEGQPLQLSVASDKINLDDIKTAVACVTWKLRSGATPAAAGEARKIDGIPIRTPGNQQQTRSLTFPVPVMPERPGVAAGEYTPDRAAPIANIRAFLFDKSGSVVTEILTSVAVVHANDYCNIPNLGTLTQNGTVSLKGTKSWQPEGGDIELIATRRTTQGGGIIKTCFRWKQTHDKDSESPAVEFRPSDSTRVLEAQPGSTTLAAAVPSLGVPPPHTVYSIVPQADVRVLIFDENLNAVLDATTRLGITNVAIAGIIAAVTLIAVLVMLWLVSRSRYKVMTRNPFLGLITTRQGYASLSQLQIMLWTFVVIASAAYVIALSGELIPITTGTLVLLGISGTATLVSKVKSENDAAASEPTLDPATAAGEARVAELEAAQAQESAGTAPAERKHEAELAEREATANAHAAKARMESAEAAAAAARARAAVASTPEPDKARAEQAAVEAERVAGEKRKAAAVAAADAIICRRIRHPRWSDLVMEEIKGRELDVTRIQMLCFTLVTAAFVALKVLTSYNIPEIDQSFLILMGISNGVYLGSKYATNPAAK